MKDRQIKRRTAIPVPKSLTAPAARRADGPHAEKKVAAVEGEAPCPRCGTQGIVDFLDLIRGRAELHCPACPTGWALETEAPMAHLGR